MKLNLKYLFIPIIIGIFTLILITLTKEVKNVSLNNFNEASSYIENGWIPDNLPENSKNINLIYDLDSNIVNGKFILENENDISNFKSSLSKLQNISNINLRFLDKEFKKLISQISSYENNIFIYKDFIFFHNGNSEFYFISNEKV